MSEPSAPAKAPAADPSLIKKITVKTCCGKLTAPVKPTLVMRLFGQASDKKPGQSNLGEYVALVGTFEAIALATGEAFRSGRAILPPLVTDLITGQMAENKTIQFAFDIGIKPSNSPVGYDYYCVSLIDSKDSDPLASLKHQVASKDVKAPPEDKDKKGGAKAGEKVK